MGRNSGGAGRAGRSEKTRKPVTDKKQWKKGDTHVIGDLSKRKEGATDQT
jgi:hypothetical protein